MTVSGSDVSCYWPRKIMPSSARWVCYWGSLGDFGENREHSGGLGCRAEAVAGWGKVGGNKDVDTVRTAFLTL